MDLANATMVGGYYGAFINAWNATSGTDPELRAVEAAGNAAPEYIDGLPLQDEQKEFLRGVFNEFNTTNFNNESAIREFAIEVIIAGSGIEDPEFLRWFLGFLEETYNLGPDYSIDDPRIAELAYSVISERAIFDLPFDVPEQLLNSFVSEDRRTMLVVFNFDVSASYVDDDGRYPLLENVKTIRKEIAALNGEMKAPSAVYVTGEAAISEDMRASSEADMKMIEPVTIVIIFILMGILFRSVIAQFLPLGAVGVAVGISQALMFAVGVLVAPVNVMVTTLLFSILMAVGTDYAIFIVSRYREERVKGSSRQEAVHASVTWAGESIATSGATVIIAFFAMTISSFPMVQVMGLVLGLGILVALLVSLTLVPSILLLVGNRIFWPNTGERWKRYASNLMKAKSKAVHGYFHRAANFSVKHAKVILVASILVS
ncbi:MAG TPA: MMPL family transporter, partial [Methanomassiliicoccaceae archaeon]|nr:MMPL family transporter [Methanomassiliicoccaceae archaeon]